MKKNVAAMETYLHNYIVYSDDMWVRDDVRL